MREHSPDSRTLFGGDGRWNGEDWTASDDRVRGGASQVGSVLAIATYGEPHKHRATFHGNLDTQTLGGAGFASHRTVEPLHLDLSDYDGLELVLDPTVSDNRKYTFIFKDEILPRNPLNGREQSTLSWEFDFEVPKASTCGSQEHAVTLFVPWQRFTATYRGKPKKDAKGPDLSKIERLSIMMRRLSTCPLGEHHD
ncbi:uncharacterized protein HMPREF1541_00701 [Cyphellophora europaea CBS 101466]|uniref:NADH:ubiquinone oxidoreductase intermediate-associated protein 30 domain-containing protein n=1 Tax=Cyphellophora europaea (strain CBS 101466) TaxID=1220924 RepID=W2SCR9_CYPE1|nr:uncharacterized protein HMPREF1541_00701 [Cyphellophora europaea CBS 101466]ETN46516.1 hypothetical protein HMPREF1541_00701 [Cyphellophora europaea CBS 101466]